MHICSTKSKIDRRKENFCEYVSREWATHHMSELIIRMGDLNGHVGREIDGFQWVHREFNIDE